MRSFIVLALFACLAAVSFADVVGPLVGQDCVTATATGPCAAGTVSGGGRQVCDKTGSGANSDVCRSAGNTITVNSVQYTLCLSNYDCPSSAPVCAVNTALDGTTVCNPCLNNTQCDDWAKSDTDTADSSYVCSRFPTSTGNLGSCRNPGTTHTVNLPNKQTYTYTLCRDDSHCSSELYQSCQTVHGDFRLGTNEKTTVCGCQNSAGCTTTNSEFKVCDLTGTLSIQVTSGAPPVTVTTLVRAPGTCRDPRAPTFDSTTASSRRTCVENSDCSPFLPRCTNYTTVYPTGVTGAISQDTTTCQGCIADSDCAWYPGTVCHLSPVTIRGVAVAVGTCAIPVCNSNHECYNTSASVCSAPGNSTGRCVGCASAEDCALFPTTPYCTSSDSAARGVCTEGCYTDGNCAEGFRCFENSCVECISAYDCYNRNHTRPICSADNECVFCSEDEECLSGLPLFEACHTEFEDDVQVKGECVQDTYQKGFQIAALILGTLGVFFVIIALVVAVMAFTKGGD